MILAALRSQPFVCLSVLLNLGSVAWNLTNKNWGLAIYWMAAAVLTVVATWGRGWHG
jgi:hypothetical protein